MEVIARLPDSSDEQRFWLQTDIRGAQGSGRSALQEIRRQFTSSARYTLLEGENANQYLVLGNGGTEHTPIAALLAHASKAKAKAICLLQTFVIDPDESGAGKRVYCWIKAQDGLIVGGKEVLYWDREVAMTAVVRAGLLKGHSSTTELYGDIAVVVSQKAKPLSDLLSFYEDYEPEWQRVKSLWLRNTLAASATVSVVAFGASYAWNAYQEGVAAERQEAEQRMAAEASYQQAVREILSAPSPEWLVDNVDAVLEEHGPMAGTWRMSGVRCNVSECEVAWVPNDGYADFRQFEVASGIPMEDLEVWDADQKVASDVEGIRIQEFKGSKRYQIRYRFPPPVPLPTYMEGEELELGDYWQVQQYCQGVGQVGVDCTTTAPVPTSISFQHYLSGDRPMFSKATWTLLGGLDTYHRITNDLSSLNWMRGTELSLINNPQYGYKWKMDGSYALSQ